MKIKAGRFLLVFVSFNVLFLSLYVFTSSLSARIFSEDEPGFIWNGRIQKSESVSDGGSALPESLLSVSLPINGGDSGSEKLISDERELVSGDGNSENFLTLESEIQAAKIEPSSENYFGEKRGQLDEKGILAELKTEKLVELSMSADLKTENQELLIAAVTDLEEAGIALSEKRMEKFVEESEKPMEEFESLPEPKKPVEKSEPLSEIKRNWIEEWEESGVALVLNHVIHNPFERAHKPVIYVKRTAEGFQVRLQKSALRNLHGDLLAQDHLELWLQDKNIRPPANYGEISYQFGIGLGEKPWISEFLGTEPELNLQVVRTELDGFIEIQITGLSQKKYEWNLVFSGSFFQQEWVQGYLLSAAENFRWGCPDGLLR
jgi:hypothetical protein